MWRNIKSDLKKAPNRKRGLSISFHQMLPGPLSSSSSILVCERLYIIFLVSAVLLGQVSPGTKGGVNHRRTFCCVWISLTPIIERSSLDRRALVKNKKTSRRAHRSFGVVREAAVQTLGVSVACGRLVNREWVVEDKPIGL